jgi:uncharacterized protein YpmS
VKFVKYLIWCKVLFWKRLIIVILVAAPLCTLVAAFIYIPKYLDEEQQLRDNSTSCKQYREFLQTAENWNRIGDTVQANGVYSIAVNLFRKGKCTRVH